MKIEGSQTIAAPRDAVWNAMMESGRFTQAINHYQLLKSLGNHQFRGILNAGVGPLRGRHTVTTRLSHIEPLVGFQLEFEGQGVMGTFAGNGRVRLDAHDQMTTVHYEGDLTVKGRLAELPPRLLQANLNAIIRRTIEGIDILLWPEKHTPGAASPDAAPTSTAQNPLIIGLLALAGALAFVVIGKALFSQKSKSAV